MLPSISFSKSNTEKEKYDNHYVNYVYENYLKNKQSQYYEVDTIQRDVVEETSIYNMPVIVTNELITETQIEEVDTSNQTQLSSAMSNTDTPTDNAEDDKYNFYFGLGLGISKLDNYKSQQPLFSLEKATMEPEDSSNVYANFGLNNIFEDFINLEVELGYVENKKITTPDENGVYLIDYNQNLKTYNLGANLIFNMLNIDSMFIPYIGFGLGVAKLELADFGTIIIPNVGGAKFKSKSESKNTFYGKIEAGIMYSLNKTSKFVIGAEYIMYNDVDYKYINMQDLSRINFNAGLKFYF